jgi:integrase/recombinase XerD
MSNRKNGRRKPERGLGHTTLQMLIEFYTGDMQRRGLTRDSVYTNAGILRRFQSYLAPGGASVKMAAISPERAKAYVTSLQERGSKWVNHPNHPVEHAPLSPFTIRKAVIVLRGFGTWLEKQGYPNPFDELDIPRVPKYVIDVLTDEEIAKIVAAISPNNSVGGRIYAIILLLLDSGLRAGEVADARLPNLDLKRRQLKVMGKGRKERLVPFGQRCGQALMRYTHLYRPEPRRPDYDQLFLSPDGVPMNRNSLQLVIRRLRLATGITRLHAHLFRHTFAVKFLTNGGDLRTLQLILGHESLVVTQRYLHFTDAHVQVQYQAYSPVDKLEISGLRRFGNKRRKGTADLADL